MAHIVVVEDEHELAHLIAQTLRDDRHTTEIIRDGQVALDRLTGSGRITPDLIILDLHMPPPDGFELLGLLSPWTRGSTRLPVLVTTADEDTDARQRALAAGAKDFLTKPINPSELVARAENLLESRLLQLELREKNKELEKRVDFKTVELAEAGMELLEPLAFAAEYRDEGARDHPLRVGRASALLAQELGLDEETVSLIGRAARLHDVGKLGLSDTVLLNTGRYKPEEFELMKTHTIIGAEILGRGRSRLVRMAAEIARTHHERWNGSGYPEGLEGDRIPLPGRIVALVDTFEALTHHRVYRGARPLPEAVSEVLALAGQDFDPCVVNAFGGLDHDALVAPVEKIKASL